MREPSSCPFAGQRGAGLQAGEALKPQGANDTPGASIHSLLVDHGIAEHGLGTRALNAEASDLH